MLREMNNLNNIEIADYLDALQSIAQQRIKELKEEQSQEQEQNTNEETQTQEQTTNKETQSKVYSQEEIDRLAKLYIKTGKLNFLHKPDAELLEQVYQKINELQNNTTSYKR